MKIKTFRFLLTATPEYIDEKINEFLTGGEEPVMLADCKIAQAGNFVIYTLVTHDPALMNMQPNMEVNIVDENGQPLTDEQGIIKG